MSHSLSVASANKMGDPKQNTILYIYLFLAGRPGLTPSLLVVSTDPNKPGDKSFFVEGGAQRGAARERAGLPGRRSGSKRRVESRASDPEVHAEAPILGFQRGAKHGCRWETFYVFAYCGLVGNPHLTSKSYIFAPLPTSIKKRKRPSLGFPYLRNAC